MRRSVAALRNAPFQKQLSRVCQKKIPFSIKILMKSVNADSRLRFIDISISKQILNACNTDKNELTGAAYELSVGVVKIFFFSQCF